MARKKNKATSKTEKDVKTNLKDIVLENISISVPNKKLLVDTDLKIVYRRRYGLIGHNGLGKSTLLKKIANREELDIPKNLDIFLVDQEVHADPNKTAFQTVIEANTRRTKWMKRYDELKPMVEEAEDVEDELLERYEKICAKLEALKPEQEEKRARQILNGLGIEGERQDWTMDKFSGGFLVRIGLCRGLYRCPQILFLDEPTNHLDLNATIWLTDLLSKWKKTLVLVSHDKHFLNQVCTDIIHLADHKLSYYHGNYDQFLKGHDIKLAEMSNEWRKIEQRVREMQKKSTPKDKVQKFLEENATKEPPKPYKPRISFQEPAHIDAPLIQLREVAFGYNPEHLLFKDIEFDIHMDSRYVIVGKNGVGKSSLIKLLTGENKPMAGYILHDQRCRIGYFHQHSADALPLDITPVEHLLQINKKLGAQNAHRLLGSIGLESPLHTKPIETMSGGQKARVAFCAIQALPNVSLLIFDEPSNHLDIETREALIEGLRKYEGGLVMITHDLALIEELDCELLELVDGEMEKTDLDNYYDKVLEELAE